MYMKQTACILTTAILAISASGCSILSKTSTKNTITVNNATGEVVVTKPSQTVAAIDNIIYGEWTVANVNNEAVTGDDRPYVVFDTAGVNNPFEIKIYANNGCNVLNGAMAVTPGGDMKKASDFLSTMKFCADAPYEIGINMAFENVAKFNIEKIGNDYLLYMKNKSGNTLMILRKSDISFINGAWEITKIGNTVIPTGSDMKLVIDIPELKVHGNTGCNILNGNLITDPDIQNSLQFKDIATTKMMCPDAQKEQNLLIALEEVETVSPGTDGQTALLKNSRGETLITLRRLTLK